MTISDKKLYIGCDPGKGGGIAFITEDGFCYGAETFPIVGKIIDWEELAYMIKEFVDNLKPRVCIEKVHSMPKQGVKSMFTFGMMAGGLYGLFGALAYPVYTVPSQEWKKVVLSGTKKDKDAAAEFARKRYPDVSLLATERSRKPHSGMADAICIAHFGYIQRI